MDNVTSNEAEKPEYIYRPSIYFHAADDADAKSRAAMLRYEIENMLEGNANTKEWAYDQAWNDADSLQERLHFPPTPPTRIVS